MKDQFFQNETYRFTLCDDMIHKSRILTIITARKRSLGQGNKFTGVCLSTGGGVPDQVHPQRSRHPPVAFWVNKPLLDTRNVEQRRCTYVH